MMGYNIYLLNRFIKKNIFSEYIITEGNVKG